jgi:hypothetical protein
MAARDRVSYVFAVSGNKFSAHARVILAALRFAIAICF